MAYTLYVNNYIRLCMQYAHNDWQLLSLRPFLDVCRLCLNAFGVISKKYMTELQIAT